MTDSKTAFTHMQHHLLEWLAKEDSSLYGECHGTDLDRLFELHLVDWKAKDMRGPMFSRVGLTEKGIAKARELREWKP